MAKDGTNRGGRRVKAGGKPASLADKIASGKSARVFEPFDFDVDGNFESDDFVNMPELEGENISKPSEYLSAEQKDGTHLKADKIFKARPHKWRQKKSRGSNSSQKAKKDTGEHLFFLLKTSRNQTERPKRLSAR